MDPINSPLQTNSPKPDEGNTEYLDAPRGYATHKPFESLLHPCPFDIVWVWVWHRTGFGQLT